MATNLEKNTPTNTPQKFRTVKFWAYLVIGTFMLGLTGYGLGQWIGAVIGAVLLPALALSMLRNRQRKE